MNEQNEIPEEDNVKFSYILDKNNPHRRLTIARKVENGLITFGLALNRCFNTRTTSWGSNNRLGIDIRKAYPIDTFSKDMGRLISRNRLNHPDIGLIIPQEEGLAPHISILKHLANTSDNHTIRRMARQYLETPYTKKAEPKRMSK